MRRSLINNLKNIPGWRTKRKLVVFSIDDYGNVRLASRNAREEMDREGLKVHSRFDAYDTLETTQDLEMLFDVLTSVTDSNRKHAVFTPFAVPCNLDFERIEQEGHARYVYEKLPITYEKLAAIDTASYGSTWKLWQQGIAEEIFVPQFHGREHLNIKVFEEKLRAKDHELLTALKYRSYTSISSSGYPTIGTTAAFEFDRFEENDTFEDIILDGLDAFESVFGFRAVHFNPPGGREHSVIHNAFRRGGIRYLDTPWLKMEHQGNGRFRRIFNYTGKSTPLGQIHIVRNAVFEPTDHRGMDWVTYTLKQIEAAFRWRRPAIISSHRVNFCGHVDPENRKAGLEALGKLLDKIVTKWPDVEFLAANELGDLIAADRNGLSK